MGELIAVLSGKGGTGKTSLCAGIATALAAEGKTVLCIDCDIGLRNLDLSLAMADSGALSFTDVSQGGYSLSDASVHPDFPNLSFLTAPVNMTADEIDTKAFAEMLRKARKLYTYIFLDAPAGLDGGFRLCAQYADRVILVTNPEPSAIRDAASTGRRLEMMGITQTRIVVNRVKKKLLDATRRTVDDVMDDAGLPLLGVVPEDENVTFAAAFEKPLLKYTRKGAAAACRRIARRLRGLSEPVAIR